MRKFLNEQNTEAMDNQLLKQALSVSAAENSKKTAQTGPWVLQENPQPATDTAAKSASEPTAAAAAQRTARPVEEAGAAGRDKTSRRQLSHTTSRVSWRRRATTSPTRAESRTGRTERTP